MPDDTVAGTKQQPFSSILHDDETTALNVPVYSVEHVKDVAESITLISFQMWYRVTTGQSTPGHS